MTTVPPPVAVRTTLESLRRWKAAGEKFAMLTCYDYPTARILQSAGIRTLLVGDSAAMTVLGFPDTTHAPLDFLVTLTAAVRRGAPDVFLMGDLPYGSIATPAEAVANAHKFIDAGADAVKLECTAEQLPVISALAHAGIAPCAHLGLLPQHAPAEGGYRAKGRTAEEADRIVQLARDVVAAGAQLLLLEAVPNEVSSLVTAAVPPSIPVIGCGAGPSCDGHVVVLHDLLGYTDRPPKFVDPLTHVPALIHQAAQQYAADIQTAAYPADRHQYHMKKA